MQARGEGRLAACRGIRVRARRSCFDLVCAAASPATGIVCDSVGPRVSLVPLVIVVCHSAGNGAGATACPERHRRVCDHREGDLLQRGQGVEALPAARAHRERRHPAGRSEQGRPGRRSGRGGRPVEGSDQPLRACDADQRDPRHMRWSTRQSTATGCLSSPQEHASCDCVAALWARSWYRCRT